MYTYLGDVNLVYGGSFYDLSSFADGYVKAVCITDLDSATGFDGAVLIEHLTVLVDNEKSNLAALGCCGVSPQQFSSLKPPTRRLMLCDSLLCYGRSEPDDSWDNYHSRYDEIIQTTKDGPMQFDDWRADKRITTDLRRYVRIHHLGLTR